MIVCKKKRCIWRVHCGEGKAVCSVYRCPYATDYIEELPKIKWIGIAKHTSKKYDYNASKRNKKGNNE